MDKKKLKREIQKEIARKDLWYFCHLLYPDFYTEDKEYLKGLCKVIQSRPKKLMINMAPRSGKSLTLGLAEAWFFGLDPKERVITVSYNETLSGRFSKNVRNTIEATRQDDDMFVFSDIFPNVKIKRGDSSASLWSLEGTYFSYIGAGVGSSITGLGCTTLCVDDLIKNAKEAYTSHVLDNHYDFYKNTLLSRLETGGQIIIVSTRWSSDDLCGKLLEDEPEEWVVYSIKMEQDDGTSLCEDIMTTEEILAKKKTMSPEIWQANYNQTIILSSNRLYTQGFNLFREVDDVTKKQIIIDVADKGDDRLSAVSFLKNGNYYDVYDTFLDKSELVNLEDKLVRWILRQNANIVFIEGNGAGNYFSHNLRKKLSSEGIVIRTYTTISNKEARIKSASWWLQEWVRFHKSLQHSEYLLQVIGFSNKFKSNPHDDAVDTLTAIYDIFAKRQNVSGGIRI